MNERPAAVTAQRGESIFGDDLDDLGAKRPLVLALRFLRPIDRRHGHAFELTLQRRLVDTSAWQPSSTLEQSPPRSTS